MPQLMELAGINLSSTVGGLMNIFAMIITLVVVGAITFMIIYFLNERYLSFKTPVRLRVEVGNNIVVLRDKLRIRRKDDKYEIQLMKNKNFLIKEPSDQDAFFVKGGFGRMTKTFEYFVRNEQATPIPPHPQDFIEREVKVENEQGEVEKQLIQVPLLRIMPANLVRSYIDKLRKAHDLTINKKWWENPAVWAFGMMGVFLIGVIFLFIMNKNTAEISLEAVRMGGRVMEQAAGQVVN